MSFLSDFPYPVETLYSPRGTIGMDEGGTGASLAFHVGAGLAGGSPDHIIPFLTFVGGTTETTTIGGVSVERIVPLRHPFLPDMVAVRARCEGTGKGIPTTPGYTDARVMVDFGVPPYVFGGDTPYSSKQRRIGASSITLPGKAFAVSGVPMEHDVAKNVPEIIYSYTFYNLPTQTDDVYVTLAGKLNNATFLGRPAETVRFDGVEDEEATTIAFTKSYTVTLSLAWRPVSWNYVLLPSGVWAKPLNINDGTGIYETGNFALLLG